MSPSAVADRATLIAWAQKFARYPSQQTALFEQEPEVQGFIADCVMPLVRELGLPARRDRMGNLLVEIGPPDTGRSLMLMAYAMTHPAAAMKNPFAGELVDTPAGEAVRGRGIVGRMGAVRGEGDRGIARPREITVIGSQYDHVAKVLEQTRHHPVTQAGRARPSCHGTRCRSPRHPGPTPGSRGSRTPVAASCRGGRYHCRRRASISPSQRTAYEVPARWRRL